MVVSGACGFILFIIANFTNAFRGSRIVAGCLQLGINLFVFVTWGNAFLHSSGFKKFVAFWGIVVPVVMASITTWRVFVPRLRRKEQ